MSLGDNDLARNERARTARQISPRRHRAEFLSLYHTAGFSGSIRVVSIESFNAEERGGVEGAEDDAPVVIPRAAPPFVIPTLAWLARNDTAVAVEIPREA